MLYIKVETGDTSRIFEASEIQVTPDKVIITGHHGKPEDCAMLLPKKEFQNVYVMGRDGRTIEVINGVALRPKPTAGL